ncbi:signal peptide peptidase SppA, 36K type [Kribbella flavida DSM 17836]|uniref:Signal peptide peptidase SppA, 36K type n=1 Tax=Kribbella flavida (strain DSM 17836 / JCM 10339 / NBRC 14399) TaxID=479435 RepID=D2Q3D6_KRIFD|nr:signal peptide peptidase SppA [Kribbella flavida]ADB34059.1 signal peptide peptidase SppA, 36K type [Kribbella flavida DSM 17836]
MTGIVLELDLTRGVLETPPGSPLAAVRARHLPTVRELVVGLRKAAEDEQVVGLVAHVGGPALSLAQVQELRTAVVGFRAAGKRAVAWSESFGEAGGGTVPYYLATAFDEIWVQPSGELGITGVSVQATFVRGALDKAGVIPQFGKRREYKTAVDTFTEKEMTGPAREMAARLAESAYEQLVEGIAGERELSVERVRELVDNAPLAAEAGREAGLVDRLGYRSDVYDELEKRFGPTTALLVERYHRRGPRTLHDALDNLPWPPKPTVAVIRVNGGITVGRSSGGGPLGSPRSGSDTITAALRAVAADDKVKAVVLRIDSPGGSYVASDAIRHEVLRLRSTGKPVIASMGSVAASGGYFVAMPADVVVAQPGTITGSIGVLSGKGVVRDALGRIGITQQAVSEGTNARMYSAQEEFSPQQWERLEETLDRIYADFVAKAAEDRGLGVDELEALARGRVWTGADAHRHQLVDELGGFEHALQLACARAGLDRDHIAVTAAPHRTFLDRLRPPTSTDDLAATTQPLTVDGLTTSLYAALGLPPTGALTMPLNWTIG